MTGNELRQLLIGRSKEDVAAKSPARFTSSLTIEDEEFEDLVIEDLNINSVMFKRCSFLSNVRFVRCTLHNVKFLNCSLSTHTPLLEQCIGANIEIEMVRQYPVLAPLMHKCLLADTHVRANQRRIDDYIASDSMLPALTWMGQGKNRSFRFSKSFAPDLRFHTEGDGAAHGLEPAPSLHNILRVRIYDQHPHKSTSVQALLQAGTLEHALPAMYHFEELSLAGKWSSICSDDPMKLDPVMCADFLTQKVAKTSEEYKLVPPHMREVDFVRAVVSVLVQQLVMYQSICLGAGK